MTGNGPCAAEFPVMVKQAHDRSNMKARKTLEQRLLMPPSSNLMSEVTRALRNQTLFSHESTKEAKEALRLRLFRQKHSLLMKDAN